jgi:hypothetical protein
MDSTFCVLRDSPAHHLVTYWHAGRSDSNSGRRNGKMKTSSSCWSLVSFISWRHLGGQGAAQA